MLSGITAKLKSAPQGRYMLAMGAAHRHKVQLSKAAKRRNTLIFTLTACSLPDWFLRSHPAINSLSHLYPKIFHTSQTH